jgi:hypothetical protein
MFARRANREAATEPKAGERQRAGRGLGPFTGGQLTVIVMTFAVLLLVPIGAWAVTGSNIFVTDATSGTRAKVDSTGNLQTKTNAVTTELKSGSGVPVAASGTVLVPSLDVSKDGQIRVTVGNSSFSASAVNIGIAHIENPGTSGANAIDSLDLFTVPIGQNISRSYAVPGRTIEVSASPANGHAGSTVFFTIFGR